MSPERTVGDLLAEIRNAVRWAGRQDPRAKVLRECGYAITELAEKLGTARGEIARLQAEVDRLGAA